MSNKETESRVDPDLVQAKAKAICKLGLVIQEWKMNIPKNMGLWKWRKTWSKVLRILYMRYVNACISKIYTCEAHNAYSFGSTIFT